MFLEAGTISTNILNVLDRFQCLQIK